MVDNLLFLWISQVLSLLLLSFMNHHVIEWPPPRQGMPMELCGLMILGLGCGFLAMSHGSAFQWELVEPLLCARLHAVYWDFKGDLVPARGEIQGEVS